MDRNRVWAEVNLDAILENLNAMHNNMKADSKIMAVLKTDGYGHGATPIARQLESVEYVFGYAAATIDEAVELRRAGIKKPILILGATFASSYETVIREEIRPAVFTYEMAKAYSDTAVALGKTLPIHIKIDTGMGRLGFPVNRESVEELVKIASLPNLKTEGIFTHFARADELDKTHTRVQIELFSQMIRELSDHGVTFEIRHASNSAGILELPEANFDMCQAGITLYGLWPSEEMDHEFPLQAALSLYSHIVSIKTFAEGSAISYGGTYITEENTKVAVVPVGYGDGYARSLSGKGYVLLHGHKAPIIGRICMDQFMIDITGMEDVQIGDKVTLVGEDGAHRITMEKLGELSGRFNYEFACDLGNRIPRLYLKNGVVVEEKDYYHDVF